MQNKSFTLIELLVVIVIIGILAGVIIVSVSSSISKANFAKAQAFSNTVQNELLGDLVSEWTFDNPSLPGEDTWGNNDGIVSGATHKTKASGECVYGGCMSFDGVDDYINLGQNVINFNNNSFTFSSWTYFRSFTNRGSVYNCVAGMGSMSDYGWGIGITSDKNAFLAGIANEFLYSEQVSNLINNWHHVVLVQDTNNNEMKVYVDGVPSSSSKTTTKEISEVANFCLGRSSSSRSGDQIIDDVRIYNIILSTSQIKQEYVAGLNSLLASNGITKEEYNQRLSALAYAE